MMLEQHPVALNAVRDSRVRGVGGLLFDLMFPLQSTAVSMFDSGFDYGAELPQATATPAVPKPTFASAFGGALGQTTGKFLVYAVLIGGALWYLNKHRPKFIR